MSHKTTEKLKMEISNLNNIHISKLKHRLCFKKQMEKHLEELSQMFSNTQLRTVEK